ncbi:kinesin-like protein KIN-14R [Impatiens glandulifera]|uniref:kinesin-like protein KIN-14R n=1 Tax=Impatiens glandulifera TaxID=253017 RepID=UPI001FB089FD|nr:kinesin-like protein KIN-14R [Impatiens glandulifera]
MEDTSFSLKHDQALEIPGSPHPSVVCGVSDSTEPSSRVNEDSLMEEDELLEDSMVCDAGSSLIQTGFTLPTSTEDMVMFIIAGGVIPAEVDSSMKFIDDSYYEGGDVFQTDEPITDAGDFSFLYQSARIGDFSYHFKNVTPGDYYVDLHFIEIINTYGPKGMRVFNVFMQDEKVLSDFDIYSIVGANKPLQVVNSRISVKEDASILIRFEGVTGSPLVSGICVRRASAPQVRHEYLVCSNCAAEVEVPSAQKKIMGKKSTVKYEKKIEELKILCQQKTEECYQGWMSFTAANEQLHKVKMELDSMSFRMYSMDKTFENQGEELKNISSKYENGKKAWSVAVNNLEEKIKVMKEEHSCLSRDAHACISSIPELNKMVSAIHSLVEQCEDLKIKYNEEQAKRRKLYNEVQEAKGNIRVFCRCRPLNKAENVAGYATVVDFYAAKDGEIGIVNGSSSKKTFKFDRVYTPKDDQVDVFADASPMATSVLDGYNVCLFAYGQTGTGKTFTMEGTDQNRGVNYRTLEQLFKLAQERNDTFSYSISVSVLEVYNEQIRDLLAPSSKKLEIKQDSDGLHHVPGLAEAKVENISEVWGVLQSGSSARAVGSNNVNEHSSRSHCMLCVMVKAKNLLNGDCTKSKLWLVDLAGSERLAKTDAQGDRLKEAQSINKSLSALGDVISALANKNSHIPYRNSKLTLLLHDSLGGDSKTLMFVQISPSENDLSETLSSLNFASRVRAIELGPARKQVDTQELQKLKTMLERARQDCRVKEESLKKLEERVHFLENKEKGKDQLHKNQQEKIKDLEAQAEQQKISLQSQYEKKVTSLSESLKSKEEICMTLQQKLKEVEKKMAEQEQSDLTTYEQVKDLQNKLKEQTAESKSCIFILQQKVEELEMKLKEKDEKQAADSILHQKVEGLEVKLKEKDDEKQAADSILHQKIKELEEKLREQEEAQQLAASGKQQQQQQHMEREECLDDEQENYIRTSLDSLKRRASREPVVNNNSDQQHILQNSNFSRIPKGNNDPLKGNETSSIVHDTRRKRFSRNSETENYSGVSSVVSDIKKRRQSDQPINNKPFARTGRLVSKPAVTSHRPSSSAATTTTTTRTTTGTTTTTGQTSSRIKKEQKGPGMIREKDGSKKGWSRW